MSASAKGSPVLLALPSNLIAPVGGVPGREFWSLRLRTYITPNFKVWLPSVQVRLSVGLISTVGASSEKAGPVNCVGAPVGPPVAIATKLTLGIPAGNNPPNPPGKTEGNWKP